MNAVLVGNSPSNEFCPAFNRFTPSLCKIIGASVFWASSFKNLRGHRVRELEI
jgi:hypothetical protein